MGLYQPLNKADKTMAKSIGLAIKRLEETLDAANVRQLIYRATYTANGDFYEWKAQLKHWRQCFEAFAGVAKPETGRAVRIVPRGLALSQRTESQDNREIARAHMAVEAAARLLVSHGLRLTATQQTDTRQASEFCRVAAALTGNKRAKLYHHCYAYIQKARNKVRS